MNTTKTMYKWQLDFLDKMQKYKGRGVVQITGRNAGKSQTTAQAIQRLMEDLASRPVEDLNLTVGTVYGKLYFIIEPIGGNWFDMEDWCRKTFGEAGTDMWGEKRAPKPAERWYMNSRRFWFKNKKDRDWFILRWSA